MSILSFRLSILHLIQCTGRCACCVLLNAKRKTWYDLTMSQEQLVTYGRQGLTVSSVYSWWTIKSQLFCKFLFFIFLSNSCDCVFPLSQIQKNSSENITVVLLCVTVDNFGADFLHEIAEMGGGGQICRYPTQKIFKVSHGILLFLKLDIRVAFDQ